MGFVDSLVCAVCELEVLDEVPQIVPGQHGPVPLHEGCVGSRFVDFVLAPDDPFSVN